MVTKQEIINAIELGEDLFLVEVKELPDDAFEVFIDSDSRVSVEDCIALTRAINAHFGEELDDYSLTVSSAGVGQPLKMLRQYQKLLGREVDVVTKSGKKLTATLEAADEESITINGEKTPLTEIKTTKEHIDFK